MKLLIKDVDLGYLSTHYENIEFFMFQSDDSFSFISCVACICDSSVQIVSNWREIQNIISVYNQPVGGLAAWNMYLAFFTVEQVPAWDKYEIENNKFSARKIIFDGLLETPSLDQLSIELEKQLFGADLTLDLRVHEPREALLSLEKYVRGAPLDSKNKSRETRALMINHIIEHLSKNEN